MSETDPESEKIWDSIGQSSSCSDSYQKLVVDGREVARLYPGDSITISRGQDRDVMLFAHTNPTMQWLADANQVCICMDMDLREGSVGLYGDR